MNEEECLFLAFVLCCRVYSFRFIAILFITNLFFIASSCTLFCCT